MTLSIADMDRKINEHFDFESRDDVQGVLSTLHPNVTHDVVGWPSGPVRGRENVKPFYETLFRDLSDGHATPIKRLYGDRFLVDESMWEGRAPGRPFGLEGGNRPLKFRLLHVIEFADDGLIQKEAVWVDMAAIVQQLPQA
ncbi:MAG TPA: ester cyclase [Bryobacteraceae bacterium]|nr:ester cyclase [Bryobacteraceae bacterium]